MAEFSNTYGSTGSLTSEEIKMRFDYLVEIKDKYSDSILAIDGVNAIGIRVLRERIMVYVEDLIPEIISQIPFELDGVLVDCEEGGRSEGTPHISNRNSYMGTESLPVRTQTNRPAPGGIQFGTVAQLGTGSYGTLGGWVYSKKLHRWLGITNFHVALQRGDSEEIGIWRDGYTRFSNKVTITIADGGTPYTGEGIQPADIAMDRTLWPNISSLSSTNPKVGDLITITGTNFTRNQWSRVCFNDKYAKIVSWTQTEIQCYVPDFIVGTSVQVFVDRRDGVLQMNKVDISKSEYYRPKLAMVDEAGSFNNWYDTGDYCLCSAINDADISPIIKEDFGINKPLEDRWFTIYEGLPLCKTGQTTGTTYSVVKEPARNISGYFSDWANGNQTYRNCIIVHSEYPVTLDNPANYTPSYDGPYMSDGGDSGSIVYTPDLDAYHNWMINYMKHDYQDPTSPYHYFITEDYKPNHIVGLNFSGALSYRGGGTYGEAHIIPWSKIEAWHGAELTPYKEKPIALQMTAESTTISNIELKKLYDVINVNANITSITSVQIYTVNEITINAFNLETYIEPETSTLPNFNLVECNDSTVVVIMKIPTLVASATILPVIQIILLNTITSNATGATLAPSVVINASNYPNTANANSSIQNCLIFFDSRPAKPVLNAIRINQTTVQLSWT